ncbi:MAG: hypothetical protein JW888_03640 [Pirellulales bacterium]|nr:hypothetical protein [Pirellulales bacterium]
MSDKQPSRRSLTPALLAALHGALWIVFWGMIFQQVGSFQKIFIDFDVELPVMTAWAITLANCLHGYWYLILPVMAALWVGDLVVVYALYQRPKLAVLKWLWLIAMFLLPLGAIAWIVVALWIPLISLTQSLS